MTLEEAAAGTRFRVTRDFTDEWLHDLIHFDGGLHELVHVPKGAEGVVHSPHGTPDGYGYIDAHFPDLHAWPPAEGGGVRVQTHVSDMKKI